MYVITTKYQTNDKGAGRIVATVTKDGHRRQATVPYNHAESIPRNHGLAAGILALRVGLPWHDGIETDNPESGVWQFCWTPPVLIDLTRQSLAA
jgi:hypothetical protein